jgi:hypothetical protein
MHSIHFSLAASDIYYHASSAALGYFHIDGAWAANGLIDVKVANALELVCHAEQLGYQPNCEGTSNDTENNRNKYGRLALPVSGKSHPAKHHEKSRKPMDADNFEPIAVMVRISAAAVVNVNVPIQAAPGKAQYLGDKAQQNPH